MKNPQKTTWKRYVFSVKLQTGNYHWPDKISKLLNCWSASSPEGEGPFSGAVFDFQKLAVSLWIVNSIQTSECLLSLELGIPAGKPS